MHISSFQRFGAHKLAVVYVRATNCLMVLMIRVVPLIVAALLPAPATARGSVIHAAGAWTGIDRGHVCEAQTRSIRIAPRARPQAIAGFAFASDRSRWGEFHVRLSRPVRGGSSVILTVGTQPFLLAARGDWAWSRGSQQQAAIMDAVRTAGGMRVDTRDVAGRRFVDRYLLDGAPTAIDAAAARCAGKMPRV